tara:strand:- start:2525 stop:3529 length:1005 start_codon:yes stop_codon:yes gene_type:complete
MSAEIFRENLHRLTAAQELGFEELAKGLGFKRDDKKWLRRLWRDGLQHSHPKRIRHLQRLARFLGLFSETDLWRPSVVAAPGILLVHNDAKLWLIFVERVARFLECQKFLRIRYPKEMWDIESRYQHSDYHLVAAWTAHKYLRKPLPPDEQELLEQLEDEWGDTLEYEVKKHVVDRLLLRLQQHPAWEEFVDLIHRMFGEERFEKELSIRVHSEIKQWICESFNRLPSDDEIYQRFCVRYLSGLVDQPDEDRSDGRWHKIVTELRSNPEWQRYVEMSFDDLEHAAINDVRNKWFDAVNKSAGAIEPAVFIHVFKDRFFDLPDNSTVARAIPKNH